MYVLLTVEMAVYAYLELILFNSIRYNEDNFIDTTILRLWLINLNVEQSSALLYKRDATLP